MRTTSALHGRIARPAVTIWNAAKTLAQIIVMWAIFFCLLPIAIYKFEAILGLAYYRFPSPRLRRLAVVLFLLGGTLGGISALFIVTRGKGTPLPVDATRELVIAGPYRYVRNPMALGSFVQGFAVGFYCGSPLVLLYVLAGSIGWNYLVRPWEEADLAWRFGAPYERYRDSVRCWTPRLTPYDNDKG